MRPRKRTRSDEEPQSVSANRNFRARKVFQENSPDSSQRRSATSNVRRPTSNKIRTNGTLRLGQTASQLQSKIPERQNLKRSCQEGELNSRPTPNAFGAALTL